MSPWRTWAENGCLANAFTPFAQGILLLAAIFCTRKRALEGVRRLFGPCTPGRTWAPVPISSGLCLSQTPRLDSDGPTGLMFEDETQLMCVKLLLSSSAWD